MTENISHGITDYSPGQIDTLSSLYVIEIEDTYSYTHPFESEKKAFFIHTHRIWGNVTEQFLKKAL